METKSVLISLRRDCNRVRPRVWRIHVIGDQRLSTSLRVIRHERRIGKHAASLQFEPAPAGGKSGSLLNESRHKRRLSLHENPDEIFCFRLIHFSPLLKLVRALGCCGHGSGYSIGSRNESRAHCRSLADPDCASGASGTNPDRLACGIRRFDRSPEYFRRYSAVLKRDAGCSQIQKALHPFAGVFGTVQRMGRLKWRFQTSAVSSAGHGGAGAHEVNRPIEWTRTADFAAFDALGVGDADFTHVADANEGGDAVVEQDLALIPDEVVERIPEAGKNELAVRIDDLGVGRRILSLPSDTRDAIALNHNLNITNRRTAIAVDQYAAVDDHDGRLKRLRESGVKPRRESEEHRCKQNDPLKSRRILVFPISGGV